MLKTTRCDIGTRLDEKMEREILSEADVLECRNAVKMRSEQE